MLQFMAILSISTLLSVVAYKMQHEEIQGKHVLTAHKMDTTFSNSAGLTAISYLRTN